MNVKFETNKYQKTPLVGCVQTSKALCRKHIIGLSYYYFDVSVYALILSSSIIKFIHKKVFRIKSSYPRDLVEKCSAKFFWQNLNSKDYGKYNN